jgi:hypothetical protein
MGTRISSIGYLKKILYPTSSFWTSEELAFEFDLWNIKRKSITRKMVVKLETLFFM